MRRTVALVLVALAAGCTADSDDEQLTLPKGQSFAATTSISPRTSAFGDPVTAKIRILLDRRKVDPELMRLRAFFRPWSDQTTVQRVDQGNLTALTYTIELHCLTLSCTSSDVRELTQQFGARLVFDVGPVRDITWPEISVVSRMPENIDPDENTGEADQWPPPWRAAVALPEPTHRASPTYLVWGLGGIGALLAAGSAAAGGLLLSRGRLLRERSVPALEHALELLRRAQTPEERRAALEALAVALEGERHPRLAEPARELAWSELSPSATAAAELALRAEEGR